MLGNGDFSSWGACTLCWQIFILGRVSANASHQQRIPFKLTTKAIFGFSVKSILPSAEVCACGRGGGVNELDRIQILFLVGGFHWHPRSDAAVSLAGRTSGYRRHVPWRWH